MTRTAGRLALVAAAVLSTACGVGGGKSATPEQVAVQWLQAKASYDGGKEWELESPAYRAGATKDQAVQEAKRTKAEDCPTPKASGCLFPKGVAFRPTGQRQEGRCRRVFVHERYPDGNTSEGAVIVLPVDDNWRVIDWSPGMPDAQLEAGAARDCGVS